MNRFHVQYLSSVVRNDFKGDGVTGNTLEEPQSLDEFDINVIDLSSPRIWRSEMSKIASPDDISDLEDLGTMIRHAKRTRIMIVLPQNCSYQFDQSREYRTGRLFYEKSVELRKLIGGRLEYWINEMVTFPAGMILYENTTTSIRGTEYPAAFYFEEGYAIGEEILTRSKKSEKITTLQFQGVSFTTLQINDYEDLVRFLDGIGWISLKEQIPDWIRDMEVFDDAAVKRTITESREEILCAQRTIEQAERTLAENNRYKSILYTNGDELVAVVFEMLEQMLECDLSGFKDEKKEDFLIRLEEITLIGEIKGVTSNIKNEHVSQLDVHYQTYSEQLEEEGVTETVKAVLIMDHQRNNRLEDRQPVHENQIRLAKRNGSLIVETHTLLRLFERWRENRMDRTQIIALLKEREGLLSLSDKA